MSKIQSTKNAIRFLSVLTLGALLALPQVAQAEPVPLIEWNMPISSSSNIKSVQPTSDGGYVASDGYNVYKTDSQGNVIDQLASPGYSYLYAVKQTSDGGYILTGENENDFYLLKLNSALDVQWEKRYDFTGNEEAYSVEETYDGYVIAGQVWRASPYYFDIYLMKADLNGNRVWSSNLGGDFIGKSDTSMQRTNDGGYIVTGTYIHIPAGATEPQNDIYLAKANSRGQKEWSLYYGGPNDDEGVSVRQTTDGNYAVAGNYSWGTETDAYLAKFSPNGQNLWHQVYGGYEIDHAYNLHETSDNGQMLVGSLSSGQTSYQWFLKTLDDGTIDWDGTMNPGYLSSVVATGAGEYIVGSSDTSGGSLIRLVQDPAAMGEESIGQSTPQSIPLKKDRPTPDITINRLK